MLSLTECVWDFQNNALPDIAGTTWMRLTNHDHKTHIILSLHLIF